MEQRIIILNSDRIRKTSLRFITFMTVYSGAASRISGITHPSSEEKEDTLFQMQVSDIHGECFEVIEICKVLSTMRFN